MKLVLPIVEILQSRLYYYNEALFKKVGDGFFTILIMVDLVVNPFITSKV